MKSIPDITIKAVSIMERVYFAWLNSSPDEIAGSVGVSIGDHLLGLELPNISYALEIGLAKWAIRLAKYRRATRYGGPPPEFDWEAFNREGLALTRRLKQELGDDYRVAYAKSDDDPGAGAKVLIEMDAGEYRLARLYPEAVHYDPAEAESRWALATDHPEDAGLCVRFAAAINRTDARMMCPLLSNAIAYTSHRHGTTLTGFETAGRRLVTVLENIHHYGSRRLTRAELVTAPPGGRPILLIHQRDSDYGRPGLGRITQQAEIKGDGAGKIAAISFQPAHRAADAYRHSGLFPGLTPDAVRAESLFRGEPLGGSPDVTFALYLDGDDSRSASLPADAQRVLQAYQPALFSAHDRRDPICAEREVACFPTFDVLERMQRVRRLEGIGTAEDIRDGIHDLFEMPDFMPSPELAAHPDYPGIPDCLKPFADLDSLTGAITFINVKTMDHPAMMARGVNWMNDQRLKAWKKLQDSSG